MLKVERGAIYTVGTAGRGVGKAVVWVTRAPADTLTSPVTALITRPCPANASIKLEASTAGRAPVLPLASYGGKMTGQ